MTLAAWGSGYRIANDKKATVDNQPLFNTGLNTVKKMLGINFILAVTSFSSIVDILAPRKPG
jgi:hypothetical protein